MGGWKAAGCWWSSESFSRGSEMARGGQIKSVSGRRVALTPLTMTSGLVRHSWTISGTVKKKAGNIVQTGKDVLISWTRKAEGGLTFDSLTENKTATVQTNASGAYTYTITGELWYTDEWLSELQATCLALTVVPVAPGPLFTRFYPGAVTIDFNL